MGESGIAGFCGFILHPLWLFPEMAFVVLFVTLMSTSLNALPNTIEHYPLTNDQIQEFQQDVLEMETRSDEIARLLSAALGEDDQRTIRAKEINAAFQRLQWEMQRSNVASAS
jgi:hypothetical protein